MRHAAFTGCVVAAVLALTACQQSGGVDTQGAAPDPNNVVARVNGEPIGETALDAQMQALSARGQSVGRARALEELVTVKLLEQEAEKRGLPEQPDIAAEIERQRASLLAQHLIRAELDRQDVTDADLRARYDEQIAASKGGVEYHARHILVEEENTAQSLIDQLDEGGDFQALAREHSTGPSSSRGGDLGWFQAEEMVEPFGEAVKALETGQYTQSPVETQFGWHVVLLEDTRETEPPAFEDVRSQLRNQMISEQIQQFVSDLRQRGDVEIVEPSLEPGSGSGQAGGGTGDAATNAGEGDAAGAAAGSAGE